MHSVFCTSRLNRRGQENGNGKLFEKNALIKDAIYRTTFASHCTRVAEQVHRQEAGDKKSTEAGDMEACQRTGLKYARGTISSLLDSVSRLRNAQTTT